MMVDILIRKEIEKKNTYGHSNQQPAVIRSGSVVEPAILAETQVVREVIRIPGSGIRLVYHSSRAKGFYSTIQLQLTPASVPERLVRVHLHISIEGGLMILWLRVGSRPVLRKFTFSTGSVFGYFPLFT